MNKRNDLKALTVFSVLFIASLSYVLFKESVHLWFCESENNGASCSIVGMIHEENREFERAEKFYKKSCDLKYGIGCFKLSHFLSLKKGGPEYDKLSLEYLHKACSFEHELSCRQLNDPI